MTRSLALAALAALLLPPYSSPSVTPPKNYPIFNKISRESSSSQYIPPAAVGALVGGSGFDGGGGGGGYESSYGAPDGGGGLPTTYQYQIMPGNSYGAPGGSYGAPGGSYGVPSQSYGVSQGYSNGNGYSATSQTGSGGWDDGDDDSGSKDICSSVILPVAKILGIKAIKKIGMIKAFKWGLFLAPILGPIILPSLAPLLLPIFIIGGILYLLPILFIGGLALLILAIPIPVVVNRPTTKEASKILAKDSSRLLRNVLESGECVEKLSCQLNSMARSFSLDGWIQKVMDKSNFKGDLTQRISRGLKMDSCESLTCDPINSALSMLKSSPEGSPKATKLENASKKPKISKITKKS